MFPSRSSLWLACGLLGLGVLSCARPAGSPAEGAEPSAPSGPAVEVVFPRQNVVVTPEFESLPLVMDGAPGSRAWILVDDRVTEEVSLRGQVTVVQVPLSGDGYEVHVVGMGADSVMKPIAGFGVRIMAQEAASTLLQRQETEDAAEETGEAGQAAVDLVRIPLWPWSDIYIDDEPPHIFLTPEALCLTDVDVHRPISQADDEPLVPELMDFAHGGYTLRNDDADWRIGPNVATDQLPISSVATDLEQAPNTRENDLLRVDAHNLMGLERTYLFAFPLAAERDRDLGTSVRPVNRRQATAQELGWWTGATKAARAPGLPRPVPQGTVTAWLEGLLGGRYRLVVGVVPDGVAPAEVRYDRDRNVTDPVLGCMRQATVTVPVVDIYQGGSRRRLTAFDVYWGARPHFRAEVWPGGGTYEWATPYKLGTVVHSVPGQAVTGEVAHMNRDRVEGEPSSGATHPGHRVRASGTAPGANKAEIDGGIRVHRPSSANARGHREPTVNGDDDDRYPHRISLAYTVEGERLVRPEPLEVILPRLHATPAPQLVEGGERGVASRIGYAIDDAFSRRIRAHDVDDYLDFYGAGLKAWEALGTDANTQEGGRRNDVLVLTSVGQGLQPLPLGTAQRSQAAVHDDRMEQGVFRDSLRFVARPNQNHRMLDWRAWTGFQGNQAYQGERQVALQRQRDYNQARDQATIDGLEARDTRWTTAHTVFSIPQDVILQLRSGDDRDDLMVLEGNTLAVHPPRFFEVFPKVQNRNAPFHFHLAFQPGTVRSELVGVDRRRTPP